MVAFAVFIAPEFEGGVCSSEEDSFMVLLWTCGVMCRKSSSNLSRWLFAAAVLAAASVGGIFFSVAAAACTENAGLCAQQSASAWKPVLVEWRKQKARLEAQRFAERVKRHLGREFAKRKEQFERHQVRIERQRRTDRRRSKARQFAAARRHAAQHAHKLRHALGAKPRRFGYKKPQHHELSGSNARHVLHWRSLWRHDAHNNVQQPPSD